MGASATPAWTLARRCSSACRSPGPVSRPNTGTKAGALSISSGHVDARHSSRAWREGGGAPSGTSSRQSIQMPSTPEDSPMRALPPRPSGARQRSSQGKPSTQRGSIHKPSNESLAAPCSSRRQAISSDSSEHARPRSAVARTRATRLVAGAGCCVRPTAPSCMTEQRSSRGEFSIAVGPEVSARPVCESSVRSPGLGLTVAELQRARAIWRAIIPPARPAARLMATCKSVPVCSISTSGRPCSRIRRRQTLFPLPRSPLGYRSTSASAILSPNRHSAKCRRCRSW